MSAAALSLPWSLGAVERTNGEPVTDAAIIFLADNGWIEVEETENAGQIANLLAAAPDMLATLQALDALWAKAFPFSPEDAGAPDATVKRWREVRAVIAKAEGRS